MVECFAEPTTVLRAVPTVFEPCASRTRTAARIEPVWIVVQFTMIFRTAESRTVQAVVGPGGPCGPAGPFGPVGPAGPAGPCVPVPAGPCGPVAPSLPCSPAGPV